MNLNILRKNMYYMQMSLGLVWFCLGFLRKFPEDIWYNSWKIYVRPNPATTEAVPQAQPKLRVRLWNERKTELHELQCWKGTMKGNNRLQRPLACVRFFPRTMTEKLFCGLFSEQKVGNAIAQYKIISPCPRDACIHTCRGQ